MKKTNEYTLITGASSGIGADLAELSAQAGENLILVARSVEKMKQQAITLSAKYNVNIQIVGADLSKPNSAQKVYDEVKSRNLQVDVLINNAGYGVSGDFVSSDLLSELEMIQVNVTTPTELAKLFAAEMVTNGFGRIMNVASTAAFQPGPSMAVYCATKGYMKSFSEALSYEIRGTGVTCTCLCPGATKTAFADRANMNESLLFRLTAMESSQVAKKGWKAMQRGQRVIVTGFLNKLMAWSVAFTPRLMVLWFGRTLMAHK